MSQIKQGIMGIMFNREQRETRDKGTHSSVMARAEVVREYVRQYEEETKKNTVSYYLVKNDAHEGDGLHKFQDLVEFVHRRANNAVEWRENTGKRSDVFENLILKQMDISRSDVSFAEFHLAGPTYANLVQHELMELTMKEIEELFTKNFQILGVLETIRAIFDSYYVELLSHEKLDTCPWFGEFVYLWFDKFEVDLITKKIVATNEEAKVTRRRRAFQFHI